MIRLFLVLLALPLSAQHALTDVIDYHNGPVMAGTVNVYNVFYGDWSSNPAPALIEQFENSIGGSPYFAINTTYYMKHGNSTAAASGAISFRQSTNDLYSRGQSLSSLDVAGIITGHINDGTLPSDANGVYFLLTSADVTVQGFGVSTCGWHNHVKLTHNLDIKIAFVGDPLNFGHACQAQSPGPNGSSGADGMVNIIAHELSESITDPDFTGWYSNSTGAENADLCAWRFDPVSVGGNGAKFNMTLGGLNWLIQKLWVNANGGYCALAFP